MLFLRGRLPQAEAAARRCLALLQQGGAGVDGGGAAVAMTRLRLGAVLMGAPQGTLQRRVSTMRIVSAKRMPQHAHGMSGGSLWFCGPSEHEPPEHAS